MTHCVYLAHTDSRGLLVDKENAKRSQSKACKGCCRENFDVFVS